MDIRIPTFRHWRFAWWPWFTTAAQSEALLRLLAVGIEEKLPLAGLVEAWGMDERGVQRGKLQRLASLLGSGMPLDDAIEEVPGVLRDSDLLAIRFDAQSGTRTAAMRTLLRDAAPSAEEQRPADARYVYVYLGVVLPVAAFLTTFMQLYIVPMFRKTLHTFSVEPPAVFLWSQQFSAQVARFAPPLLLLALLLIWLAVATRAGRRLARLLSGWVVNPARDAYMADVLQMLGVAASSGRPLAGTLSTLARYHFDPIVRQKLLFARNEVEQGSDPWQGLADAGLITRQESHAVGTGKQLGNQPWVLAQLAGVKRRRVRRRSSAIASLLWPLLVIALGTFVLFQSLAIFSPLLEILHAL